MQIDYDAFLIDESEKSLLIKITSLICDLHMKE